MHRFLTSKEKQLFFSLNVISVARLFTHKCVPKRYTFVKIVYRKISYATNVYNVHRMCTEYTFVHQDTFLTLN